MAEVELPPDGLVWHMYHDHLISHCWNYKMRCQNIIRVKPAYELTERLKRFQFIKGELPMEFYFAQGNSHITSLIEKHKEAVMSLHAKECPNCSWNGKRLTFRKRRLARFRTWLRTKWFHRYDCYWPNWSHKWPWDDC